MLPSVARAIYKAFNSGVHTPNDSAAVTLTGTQTITGNKTFTGATTISSLTATSLIKSYTVKMVRAKVGATSGAVVNAADNKNSAARVPASQNAATIVFPLDGIPDGASITSYALIGQIESAGNTVTVDAALRKQTVAAGDNVDAAITGGAITQVSVTADTALSAANAGKTNVNATINADESHYILVTVTTGASTDVDLLGIAVTYSTDTSLET